MGLFGFLKNTVVDPNALRFEVQADFDGLLLSLPKECYQQCVSGEGNNWLRHQYIALKQLEEEGVSEEIANGFVVPSDIAVRLDEDSRFLLGVPSHVEGSFIANMQGITTRSDFAINLSVVLRDGSIINNPEVEGPYLRLSSSETFLLRPSELLAFEAIKEHRGSSSNNVEHKNLTLVAGLQAAKAEGMAIDLAHFEKLGVLKPNSVRVAISKETDGSLVLTPAFGGGVDQNLVDARLGQIKKTENGGTLRVGDRIVVLNKDRIKATDEILKNRRIPKEQVEAFFKSPTAFLDASLVNLEVGFSLRVRGAERFHFEPFGEADASGMDWFHSPVEVLLPDQLGVVVKDLDGLSSLVEIAQAAFEGGAGSVSFAGASIDISDYQGFSEQCDRLLERLSTSPGDEIESESVIDEVVAERASVSVDNVQADISSLVATAATAIFKGELDLSNCARAPFKHQTEGIRWVLGLALESHMKLEGDPNRISGALLADDMGLGKTYMGLVAIEQYYLYQAKQKKVQKPVLVVAPLSLLENWEAEVEKTFYTSPFRDIVVLQAGRDLKQYHFRGAGRETAQVFDSDEVLNQDAISYSLKVGIGSIERLDMDRRLVLTTYQTLRDYQFSLCLVDWSFVLFDEAQNIKNPNTLASRAAKGLKADFKLLATGTPVENSLSDFYSIMDIAQPGLLGSVEDFRGSYIQPIRTADEGDRDGVRQEVGRQLRANVGGFMLRRLKEGTLDDLPRKQLYTGSPENTQAEYMTLLAGKMRGVQLEQYDQVLEEYCLDVSVNGGQGKALAVLQRLKAVSIHPMLNQNEIYQDDGAIGAKAMIEQSAKIKSVFEILMQIQKRDEKVIIFCIGKKLQRYLKIWLESLFKIEVYIINGDTKAIAGKKLGQLSRKGYVDKFSSHIGFSVIIMSPVAAGTGLTVTAANNVIHLERHWNPAKEAQATDRVYRIGQKKEVNVYYPTALHPEHVSFDQNLDQLLINKISLSDAVVTPQGLRESDFSVLS